MNDSLIYSERVTSRRTELFFIALTLSTALLFLWRIKADGFDFLAGGFFFLCCTFLFYSVNYRTLIIRITPESVKLRFGLFTWTIPVDNIEACRLDDLPVFMRMAGAGIHFMFIRGRYRASFNFLEHSRILISFKRKVGLVREISFSTRRPDEVIRHIQGAKTDPV